MNRRPKKKKPSDYPQFAFRLNNEDEKRRLAEHLESTVKLLNERAGEDAKPYSKSEVIVKALTIGLTKLRGRS